MKRPFHIFFFAIILIIPEITMAQSDELSYNEEFTYGINFNTNGGLIGGANFKWAKAVGTKQYRSIGLEIVNVKHPKEYRFRSPETGNSFLGNKSHYLFALRPFYGREFTIFRKAAEEGVFINLIVAGGPSIGMRKQYFVLYQDYPGIRDSPYSSVPYTENVQIAYIGGVGSFSDGLNQMSYSAGVHLKFALSFEFGQIKNSVAGLEAGFLIEKFTRKQKIYMDDNSQSLFTSAFLTLYFGRKY
jgi:hypothetical protein